MIQNDRRRTNATVDNVLVVRELIATPLLHTHDLVVTGAFSIDGSIDLLNLQTVNVGTGNFTNLNATNITATDIIATSMTTVSLMASDIKMGTLRANNAILTDLFNQLTMGTDQTIVVSAPTPAASRTYTMPDVLANANFIMSEGDQTINGLKTFGAITTFSANLSLSTASTIAFAKTSNQMTFTDAGNTTTLNISTTANRSYTLSNVGADASFVMTEGAQTINGVKTFTSTPVFPASSFPSLTLTNATNQLTLGTGPNNTTITSPAPGGARTYTIPAASADTEFIMGLGTQTIGGTKTFTSGVVINPVTNQLVLGGFGPTNTVTVSAVTPGGASRTYTMADAGANAFFVMTESTQTINGLKTLGNNTTFNANLILSAASTITSAKTTNQLTFTNAGNTTTLNVNTTANRTYSIVDVGFDCNFVMTSGAQTLDGLKTFSAGAVFDSSAIFNAGFTSTSGSFTDASGQLILGAFPNFIVLSAPTPAAGLTYTFEDVGVASSVVLSSRSTEAQATNITTAVTLNAPSGVITTQTATAASGATQTFTVNNTVCFATSVVIVDLHQYSGTYLTNGTPYVRVTTVADGSFNISVINIHGTNALNGTLVIHFLVC